MLSCSEYDRSIIRTTILSCLVTTCVTGNTWGDEINFEDDVRPVLQRNCVECHGAKVEKGGLRLDARPFAFRGGDSGPIFTPGKAVDSELIHRITSHDDEIRMPPTSDPLTEADQQLLRRWIDEGALWPETEYDHSASEDPRLKHWAWQALRLPQVPATPPSLMYEERFANEIDNFIYAKLSESGLNFSEEADRRTLIRRLSFDLLGLPPTAEDVQKFLDDPDPQAYEKLVDRMLGSERFGERWARHWLDIAHYADTHGFERDQRRDNAWHYRDWVIRALNSDMPYDQFLKDQIAGDVLRPEDSAAVAATGFLAAGPWDFVGQAETPSPVLKRLARADDLDDMITQVMTSACAVTIHCARCHDHKLDPVSQKEYYSLVSVFAGIRRGDRILSVREQQESVQQKATLEQKIREAREELTWLRRDGWSLADIVSGGDGHGTGKPGQGIDPATGEAIGEKRAFLDAAPTNTYRPGTVSFVDGVFIPDGGTAGTAVVTSTGLVAQGIPDTSGNAWDAIRSGPVNSQFSTALGGIEFNTDAHILLSLHANSAITFDLQKMRAAGMSDSVLLRADIGYFGETPAAGASVHGFLDGECCFQRLSLGRDDGLQILAIPIPSDARFLTLMSTDNGNGIGHDQICFADAWLEPTTASDDNARQTRIAELTSKMIELQQKVSAIPEPAKIYAAVSETPPVVHMQLRGNPEQPGEVVTPATISCLADLPAAFGDQSLSDAQRRTALAEWIVSPQNPLTPRVIVNRLWHHHFGAGLVDTPSDFGLGGSLPSHPELLDWLALQLLEDRWSLKSVHRRICLSAAYRQTSRRSNSAAAKTAYAVDSGNRLLWRQNPRRLDAESVRDAVLTVSGKINLKMYGPGYRDFEYKEEYAPVYTYITANTPELWRRSIYRFVVRTTPDQFMATLDCPNPANLTPVRNMTTTSLQALALLNNEFMIRQAEFLAQRVSTECPDGDFQQIERLFQIAFGRSPTQTETVPAKELVREKGLVELCRAVLNANEFIYID